MENPPTISVTTLCTKCGIDLVGKPLKGKCPGCDKAYRFAPRPVSNALGPTFTDMRSMLERHDLRQQVFKRLEK